MRRATKGIKTSPKYLRFRSYKNFSNQQYRQNILDHHLYVISLNEPDVNINTENLQNILKDSMDIMAPMTTIQMSKQNKDKPSEDIRTKMAERDLAHFISKQTNTTEDIRHKKL